MQQLPQGFVLDTPSPQSAPQAQAPGIIPGRPKAPDPYKVEQDAIDNARADAAASRAEAAEARAAAKFAEEQAAGVAAKASEGERKTSGFLKRALDAEQQYRGVQSIGPRSLPGQYFSESFPNVANAFSSSDRQQAEAAQLSFISSILRYDSGAAIPQNEIDEARRRLFPMPGDGPEVIKQKEQARYVALQGLRDAAGRLGADIDIDGTLHPRATADPDTAQQVMQWAAGVVSPSGQPADPQGSDSPAARSMRVPGATMDNIVFEMDAGTGAFGSETTGKRLTAAQEAAVQAYIKANAGNKDFSEQQFQAFFRSLGINDFNPTSNQDFYDSVRKGEGFSAATDYSKVDEDARTNADAMARERYGEDYGTRASSLLKGGLMNWSDEAAGVAGAIADTLTGGSPAEGYRRERDIERAVQRKSRNDYGIGYEIAGSLATPLGWMKAPKTVGGFVKQGSALGALAGAGEGEGAVGTGTNALLGAAGGAAVGRAIPAVGSGVNVLRQSAAGQKVGNVFSRARPEINREVVEAGQRQGIPIRQPDARPEVRNAFAAVEASPTQSQRVRNALDADAGAVQRRLEEVGGSGMGLDSLGVGERLQGAGKRYIAESGKRANALYKRAEEAAGDIQILPVQASLAIRRNINELSESGERANSGLISYLRDLNNDLARDGGISIGALRSIRSSMRGQISERNLTATDAERRVAQVLDAASEDIGKALANNPDALASFSAADKFYREKQTFIKDVVQRFTGSRNSPLSGEQAASRFQAMMREKGDYKRFSQMLSKLEPEERSDIAATIAENLGSGRNGEFSLAALSTNIGKLSPRALRDLFGEDGAKALADLKVIARAKADTRSGLNLSKSGVVMAHGNKFKELLLAAVGGGVAGVPGAVGGMAAGSAFERFSSNRAAKLLLNPDFTKWLRKTPDSTDPEVINRHFNRLNKIASRDQAFLMDAQALQDYLRRASSESVGRAAATRDQEQDDRRE